MMCPHCDKDTPATLPYCQHCGLALDLTFDKVQESFADQAVERGEKETEARTMGWMISAACALVLVVVARALLIPAAPDAPVFAPYVVEQPPEARDVEVLELVTPAIEVPR